MSAFDIPAHWRWTTIGSLCDTAKSVNPQQRGDGEFIYVDISSIDNVRKQIRQTQTISNVEAPVRARKVIITDDVLISTVRPNLNAVALVPEFLDQQICSTGLCILRAKRDILEPSYLFFWIQYPVFVQTLSAMAKGVTYPAVNESDIKRVTIPLPPLIEQKLIVSMLLEANAVRSKYYQAEEKIIALLPALFQQLFGHPLLNERGWPTRTLESMGTITTGNTPQRDNPYYYGNFIEWVKTDNLDAPLEYISPSKEGLSEAGADKGRTAPIGSTLVSCTASIGKVGLADRRVAFNQNINAVTPNQDVNPYYLYMALKLFKPAIQAMSTGGIKGTVPKSRFGKLELPYPPKALQDQFQIRAIEAINRRAQLLNLGEHIEKLLRSLFQRAFTGELTAAWRETHDEQLREQAVQRDIALGLRGAEPKIDDLRAGHVTLAEREEANRQLAQAIEQLRAVPSNAFQGLIAETFGDLSKLDVSLLLGTNAQALQALQSDVSALVTSQLSPVTQKFAEQFAELTRSITQLHADSLSLPMLQPSLELTHQLASWFASVGRLGVVLEVLKTREVLRNALTDELAELLERIGAAPTYFRPEMLVDGEISLIQVEERLRLLVALGIVRRVVVRGQSCYRITSTEREYAIPEGLEQ